MNGALSDACGLVGHLSSHAVRSVLIVL